jgi:hypothetical protein
MKAKFVNESVNFERGQDPKDAMGLGERSRLKKIFKEMIYYLELTGVAYVEEEEGEGPLFLFRGPGSGVLSSVKRELKKHGIWDYFENQYFSKKHGDTFVYFYLKPESVSILKDMNIHWRDRMDESLNFERGQEPRDAMGIGKKHDPEVYIANAIIDTNGKPLVDDYDIRKFLQNMESMGISPANLFLANLQDLTAQWIRAGDSAWSVDELKKDGYKEVFFRDKYYTIG